MVIKPFEPGQYPRQAVLKHIESGLVFGMINYEYGFEGTETLSGPVSITVDTGAFIRCWSSGEDYDFYVENQENIPKLLEIVTEFFNTPPIIVVSTNFFTQHLRELRQVTKEA